MLIPPAVLLLTLLLLTGAALVWHDVVRRPFRRELENLAREAHLAFSPSDRFNLADRVAAAFPVPGAAALCICELIYGSQGDNYRYLFVVEFTLGVVRAKHRHSCVAAFIEPKSAASNQIPHLHLAPDNLPLIEQFQTLLAATPN